MIAAATQVRPSPCHELSDRGIHVIAYHDVLYKSLPAGALSKSLGVCDDRRREAAI
jgi:hypothetical protein